MMDEYFTGKQVQVYIEEDNKDRVINEDLLLKHEDFLLIENETGSYSYSIPFYKFKLKL